MSDGIKGGGNAALRRFGGNDGSVDGIFDRLGGFVHIAADAANRVGAGGQRHQGEDGYETD
jgi:hypothetical protein